MRHCTHTSPMQAEPGEKPRRAARIPLPKAVRTLGWVSFFTDIASEMVYPIIPLFLTEVLRAPVVVLGAMEGVAEALVCVIKGLSGWRSDRIGRRTPFVRTGYALAAVSKPLLALAHAWPWVFGARMLDRLGKGLRTTARDAMIADAAPKSIMGGAFGFHRMMDTSGALVGVLAAMGLLYLLPGAYRTIFLLAALPGFVAVWLTFRLKDHPRDEEAAAAAPAPEEERRSFIASLHGLSGDYWRALAALSVFAFANSTDTLLLLRAKNLGFGDLQVMAAYVLYNFVYAVTAYPVGVLSDRIGRRRLMLGGWTLYALVYAGFAFAGRTALWALFPVYGLYMGLTEGVGKAVVAANVPPDRKGTAMGFFLMATGLLTLAGSLTAGLVWDSMGPRAPFLLGGGAALLAVLVGLLLFRFRDR